MERQTAGTVPFSQLGSDPSVDPRRVTLEQETDPLLPHTQTIIRRVAASRGYGTHTHPQDSGIDELASEGFQIDSDSELISSITLAPRCVDIDVDPRMA